MITNYQIISHVHAAIVKLIRDEAAKTKLADLNMGAKQRDVGRVKDEFEKWANWHAKKIDLARERERKRKERHEANKVPAPKV